jgi:hypothetical protein
MCLQCILAMFTPSLFSPLLFIEQFQQVSFFSYMNTKYIHHIHPPFALSLYLPSSHWNLLLEKTGFTLLFFIFLKIKVYTDSPRGLYIDTSDLYILYFNQINPPITYSFFLIVLLFICAGLGHFSLLPPPPFCNFSFS